MVKPTVAPRVGTDRRMGPERGGGGQVDERADGAAVDPVVAEEWGVGQAQDHFVGGCRDEFDTEVPGEGLVDGDGADVIEHETILAKTVYGSTAVRRLPIAGRH